MSLTRREGFVLLEAVVALLLTAALTLTALTGLAALQRHATQVRTRGEGVTTGLAALQLLRVELATVVPDAGGLLAVSPDRVVYRAVRGSGVSCGVASDGVLVRVASWRSLRLPSPGRDSVLLLSPPTGAWDRRALRASPRAATCNDGAAALLLPLAPGPGTTAPALIRTFEVMELRTYRSEGETWLGLRSVSAGEVIQPALGPLVPSGTSFTVLDGTGHPSGVLANARQLLADLRARSPRPGADQPPVPVRVPLRAGLP